MIRHVIVLLASLSWSIWAADDAVIMPSSGIAASPVVNNPLDATDAITIPRMLSCQGRLTDSFDIPVPDTTYQVNFRLYTVSSGGSPFWNETQTVRTRAGLFSVLLGSVDDIDSIPQAGNLYLGMQVGGGTELSPRLRLVSTAYSYSASNAAKLEGNDLTALDSRYVNEGQANSVSSAMITDGAVGTADIANIAVTSAKIGNGEVTMAKINQSGAATGQVIKWNGSQWAPANDSVGGGGMGDNAWVRGTPDSVLYTIRQLGIARGGSGNALHGTYRYTHTNFGVACTTGSSGQNYNYCTVAGGYRNAADGVGALVGGGEFNKALGLQATVGGGGFNISEGMSATVGGGDNNLAGDEGATIAGGHADTATGAFATIGGGRNNKAMGVDATVSGGGSNTASEQRATVGGGGANVASGSDATVAGGYGNLASGSSAAVIGGEYNTANYAVTTIGGGRMNTASGAYATIGGGYADTVKAIYGGVLSGCINLAGDAATDSGATAVGGSRNSATAKYSLVAGGYRNAATEDWAAVGGGGMNAASGAYAAVGGGYADTVKAVYGGVFSGCFNLAGDAATDSGATAAGGSRNSATAKYSFVAGGRDNAVAGEYAAIGGGSGNTASGGYAYIGGGEHNLASAGHATIAGGGSNGASGAYATICGGVYDTASANFATICGGMRNRASGEASSVAGGYFNLAFGDYSAVAGGYRDTSSGSYCFTTNNHSVVPYSYTNSAAFNGQTATASNQTRVGTLSKASGTFTIDHPLDPYGMILNHYFIEGPEMRNIYEGSVMLGADGRAEVKLPDYFAALNRNPHIQLTGVGSADVVYVAEKISGNRFVIGGRPGMEVYWLVSGERQDVSAEATRRMMPVEQPKTGELAGRMLDDDFLAGCMEQLVREGKAQGLDFRTAAGRASYELMKSPPRYEPAREE